MQILNIICKPRFILKMYIFNEWITASRDAEAIVSELYFEIIVYKNLCLINLFKIIDYK